MADPLYFPIIPAAEPAAEEIQNLTGHDVSHRL